MDDFEKEDALSEDEIKFTNLDLPEQGFRSTFFIQSKHFLHLLKYPAAKLAAITMLSTALVLIFLPDLIAISQPLFTSDASSTTSHQTQACTISQVITINEPGTYRGETYWHITRPTDATPTMMCGNEQGQQTCTVSGGTVNEISTNTDDGTWQVVTLSGTPQTVHCP